MTPKHAASLFPLFMAMLVLGVIRGARVDAWRDPATFIGLAVGLAIAGAAWIYGRRREQR